MPSWISFQPLLAALAMYYAELGERVVTEATLINANGPRVEKGAGELLEAI